MSGGGFDPCECAFSQEAAMRRLLSLLRQSQSYCTDTECENMPNLPAAQNTDMTQTYLMVFGMFFAMLMMWFMRPNSLRRQEPPVGKPPRPQRDPNDEGPGPSGIS